MAQISKRDQLHADIVRSLEPIAFLRRTDGQPLPGDKADLSRAGGAADYILDLFEREAPYGLAALTNPAGEVTGERVGHIAAIGLTAPESLTPEQIKAVCGSVLTQRPDRAI